MLLVHLAARTALHEGPSALRWLYFLHPSPRGRRLVWEHFACESAFLSGFTFLLVQPGQCPVWGCRTFPQHLHAGGCLVRQPGHGIGNKPQRGESRTSHVSSGCFATPLCCREEDSLEDTVDKVIPRHQCPQKKSLHPLLPFLSCILSFFYLWHLHYNFLRPPYLVVVEMRTR